MSVLTKVFVVLLTVFSIALSMLVVAAFAQQEGWRKSAMDWEAKAVAADSKARTITANAQIEQQRAEARDREYRDAIDGLKEDLITKARSIDQLERRVADAENQLTIEQGQVTSAIDQGRLIQTALNSDKEFSAKLAKRNSELERRNIDLNDRVKELTSDMTMAASQIRALKQQIVALGDPAGAMPVSQMPGGTAIVEAYTPTAAVPTMSSMGEEIRGEIRSIEGNLASISVGSADGVAPGMVFLIYRSGNGSSKPLYLGSVRITKVEANESAGLIEQSVGDIRLGDTARDELSFAMSG